VGLTLDKFFNQGDNIRMEAAMTKQQS